MVPPQLFLCLAHLFALGHHSLSQDLLAKHLMSTVGSHSHDPLCPVAPSQCGRSTHSHHFTLRLRVDLELALTRLPFLSRSWTMGYLFFLSSRFTAHSIGLPLPFRTRYLTRDLGSRLILGLLTLTLYLISPPLHHLRTDHLITRLILKYPGPLGISVPYHGFLVIYARTPSGRAAGLYKPCITG